MTTSLLRAVRCSGAERHTVLELPTSGVEELVAELRQRWGRPEAALWSGTTPDELAPVGWITTAPGATRRQLPSALGRLELPGEYLQITALDEDRSPLLGAWSQEQGTRALLSQSGLLPDLEMARRSVKTLRDRLDATRFPSTGPQGAVARRAMDAGSTARRLGALHLAAEAWSRAGAVLHQLGEHEQALLVHRWALGALLTSDRPADIARCRSDIGLALWRLGRSDDAVAELEHARMLLATDEAGDEAVTQRVLLRLSMPLADVGRTDEALVLVGPDVTPLAEDDGELMSRTAYARAYVLRAAHRFDEALAHGEDALQLTMDHGTLSEAAQVHTLLAELFAAAGDFVAATNHRTSVTRVVTDLRRTVSA